MRANKKILYMLAFLTAALFAVSGCSFSLDDSNVSKNRSIPSYANPDGVLPTVTAANVACYPRSTTDGEWTVEVPFSEDMLESTITSANVHVRDVSDADNGITDVAGQTVEYDAVRQMAVISFDSTETLIELVVESDVTDLSGNPLAGLAGNFDNTRDENSAADYRRSLETLLGGASGWTPSYLPVWVTLAYGALTDTTVTVTATFNTGGLDLSTITEDNFTFSPAGPEVNTYADNGTDTITITYDNMTEDTEYTLTFDPSTAVMDDGNAARTYNGSSVLLSSFTDNTVFDTYTAWSDDNISSDYVRMFRTALTTPPAVNFRVTGAPVDQTGGAKQIFRVTFSKDVDETSALDRNNYTIYDTDSRELQVDITSVYVHGATGVTDIDLSTINYSQKAIEYIIIKDTVEASDGDTLDGDNGGLGDGIQEHAADYDGDGDPDDWQYFDI